ncbi:MAG: nitrilase-related carbon-nitrogen hydrolase [Bacteroidota bacterium]|nr:nitrilase [Candidatus Kapabacteria bacterium]MDW8219203.1 nitrilase-related carbon-nitrogen hydrolase [Bacteroidota bacterium]
MQEHVSTVAVQPYKALALQLTCHAINACSNRAQAQEVISATIERLGKQIRASKGFLGHDVRLVVLPEYCLTGFPINESIEEWRNKAALDPNGKEYDTLGAIAQQNTVFLAGNVYETDQHFPDLYFQTSFVINPAGNVVLRYRRLISMFAPTPHDVWERYCEVYGLEAVFPVARTEIGALACIASEEILYPEIARCHVMRGAEVFLHSSSEISSPLLTHKNVAKLARAIENLAYVVSANSAGIIGTDIPCASVDGGSKVVDYRGIVLAEAGTGESMVASATIDIEALRRERRRVGMANILARQRFELFAASYAQHSFYPANTLLGKQADRAHFVRVQQETIETLAKAGII